MTKKSNKLEVSYKQWLEGLSDKDKVDVKNWLTRDLFNAVVDTDVFLTDGNDTIFLDGQELSTGELLGVGKEVRDFKDSKLYKVLYGTVSNSAKRRIFVEARTTEDIFAGKMLLMALDLHEKIMFAITSAYKKALNVDTEK